MPQRGWDQDAVPREREIEPKHPAPGIQCRGALEKQTGSAWVAPKQRAHTGDIEHAGGIRRCGSRLRQHPLGFLAIARLIGAIHRIDERANL